MEFAFAVLLILLFLEFVPKISEKNRGKPGIISGAIIKVMERFKVDTGEKE